MHDQLSVDGANYVNWMQTGLAALAALVKDLGVDGATKKSVANLVHLTDLKEWYISLGPMLLLGFAP